MFPSSKAVKTTALSLLRGNWVTAAAVALIPVFFVMINVVAASLTITVLSSIAAEIILTVMLVAVLLLAGIPLLLGVIKYYWNLSYCDNNDIRVVFCYFSSLKMYWRAVKTLAFVLVRIFLIGIICLLPSAFIDFVANGGLNDLLQNGIPLWFTNLWIIAIFLRGIGIAAIIFFTFKYYLVPFILVVNDNIITDEIIVISKIASKKSSVGFAGLLFGLLGWILLSFFAVPLIFTLPYMIMCYIVHSRFAIFFYNNAVNNMNSYLAKFVID